MTVDFGPSTRWQSDGHKAWEKEDIHFERHLCGHSACSYCAGRYHKGNIIKRRERLTDGHWSGRGNEECGACHIGFVLKPADNHIVSKRTSADCRMQASDKPQRHPPRKRSWKHDDAYSNQTRSHEIQQQRRERWLMISSSVSGREKTQ